MKRNSALFVLVLVIVSIAMATFGRTVVFQEGEIGRGSKLNLALDEIMTATMSTALTAANATVTALIASHNVTILAVASNTTIGAKASMTANLVTNAFWISGDGGNEGIQITSTGNILVATTTALGSTTAYVLQVNGNEYVNGAVYATGNVSALTFTDRTDCPESLEAARAIVESHEGVDGQLDHSKLNALAWGKKQNRRVVGQKEKQVDVLERSSVINRAMGAPEFVTVKKTVIEDEVVMDVVPDQSGRNLSMVVSAQALCIKDLIKRIEALEKKPIAEPKQE